MHIGKIFLPCDCLSASETHPTDTHLMCGEKDREYILNSEGKLPISENRYNSKLKAYCEKCGIPPKSSHKIRFYKISSLYDSGLDEKDIQTLSGHSSPLTTRHYNKKIKNEKLSAIKCIINNEF